MALTFEAFAKEFAEVVEENAAEVTPERELLSIPMWDSLAVVTLMGVAADKYDEILDPEKIAAATTVGDLFALLTVKVDA